MKNIPRYQDKEPSKLSPYSIYLVQLQGARCEIELTSGFRIVGKILGIDPKHLNIIVSHEGSSQLLLVRGNSISIIKKL